MGLTSCGGAHVSCERKKLYSKANTRLLFDGKALSEVGSSEESLPKSRRNTAEFTTDARTTVPREAFTTEQEIFANLLFKTYHQEGTQLAAAGIQRLQISSTAAPFFVFQ